MQWFLKEEEEEEDEKRVISHFIMAFFLPVPNNMWKWVARLESKPKHKSPGCSFKCTCEQISSSFYNFGKIQLVLTGIVTHFKRHLRLTLSKKKRWKKHFEKWHSVKLQIYKYCSPKCPFSRIPMMVICRITLLFEWKAPLVVSYCDSTKNRQHLKSTLKKIKGVVCQKHI